MSHRSSAEPPRSESSPTTPVIELTDLRVQFETPRSVIRAVDGMSFHIAAGETVALVGESGCGKSTLARAILGLVRPAGGEIRYRSNALPVLAERSKSLRRRIQMVFQDPDASLNPRLTLASSVAEPVELHESMDRGARDRRVCELFESVGLDPVLRHRYPHELSGGQKQRVCIARALAVRPDVIVYDEAVSALDVSVQAQILTLLRDLQQAFELTYLFVTHDLGVVRQIADRVVVMYLGQLVEMNETENLFEDPAHPYTRALLSAVPSVDPGARRQTQRASGDVPSPARPPNGCRFHTRCPEAFERCSREAPRLYVADRGLSRCFLVE